MKKDPYAYFTVFKNVLHQTPLLTCGRYIPVRVRRNTRSLGHKIVWLKHLIVVPTSSSMKASSPAFLYTVSFTGTKLLSSSCGEGNDKVKNKNKKRRFSWCGEQEKK
ncbi:uncharacterized protein G2W53_004501 [Senna tora]|uniref:Uncharacterized protein n=1 Tax=Senna tora TaxID=362788 RepID=A0A834XFB1_9FABA|nr:uncharacterized protein G2W53_004501 [Senna tora]